MYKALTVPICILTLGISPYPLITTATSPDFKSPNILVSIKSLIDVLSGHFLTYK